MALTFNRGRGIASKYASSLVPLGGSSPPVLPGQGLDTPVLFLLKTESPQKGNDPQAQRKVVGFMSDETYVSPEITVLGEVTDMTQKHGILFDFPGGATGDLDINIKVDIPGLIDINIS